MANFAQMHGLFADMPATHASGILYHCTDTGAIYFVKDTQILQEAIAPSAGKISKTVATGGISQGQKFGLNSGGEMVKYDVSAGLTTSLNISATFSNNTHTLSCEMASDKYAVMAPDGYLYLLKKVAGVWVKVQATTVGVTTYVWGLSKYSDTRVIIGSNTGAKVIEIDWTAMTTTVAVAQTVIDANFTTGSAVGGFLKISDSRWCSYAQNSSSGYFGKKYFDLTSTTLTPAGTMSTILSSTRASGIQGAVKDFGNGKGILFIRHGTGETGLGSMSMSFVSVSGTTTSESGFTDIGMFVSQPSMPNSNIICSLGSNKTLVSYVSNPSTALDTVCIAGCFLVNHQNNIFQSYTPIQLPKDVQIKPANGLVSGTGLFFIPVSDDEVEIYWQKTMSDVWKMRAKIIGSDFVKISEPAFFAMTALRAPTNSYEYYGARPLVDMRNGVVFTCLSSGLSIFESTSSVESVSSLGFSDQTKSEGQTAIGTLFGGVATVGTGLTAGQKVYFDATAGVNQSTTGYEIGRAVGTTDILTISQ